jgi:hypothetical protein
MRRLLLGSCVLAVLLAACNAAEAVGGSPTDAMRIADQFLAAVKARDSDAAWLLVYPPNRQARFGEDRASFNSIVGDIDLSGVAWETTDARVHDGHYHVEVELDPRAVGEALAVFIQVVDGRASMQVDIEPLWGESGVLGG